jgi:hypothetical protein
MKFNKILTYVGFVVNEANKCGYYHYSVRGLLVFIWIITIPIFETSLSLIKEVKDFLSNNFEMKDFESVMLLLSLSYWEEMMVGLHLFIPHYVEKVLSLFGYNDYKL